MPNPPPSICEIPHLSKNRFLICFAAAPPDHNQVIYFGIKVNDLNRHH